MEDIERFAIHQACTDLINRYCIYFDSRQFDAFLNLFDEAGILAFGGDGPEMKGRAAIGSFLENVARQPLMRHVASNIVIDTVDADRSTATSYFTLYRHTVTDDLSTVDPPVPAMLGVYHDQLRRGDDRRWRFEARSIEIVFGKPTSRA